MILISHLQIFIWNENHEITRPVFLQIFPAVTKYIYIYIYIIFFSYNRGKIYKYACPSTKMWVTRKVSRIQLQLHNFLNFISVHFFRPRNSPVLYYIKKGEQSQFHEWKSRLFDYILIVGTSWIKKGKRGFEFSYLKQITIQARLLQVYINENK